VGEILKRAEKKAPTERGRGNISSKGITVRRRDCTKVKASGAGT